MQKECLKQTVALEVLTKQIRLMSTGTFAPKSKKHLTNHHQLNFFTEILNEVEALEVKGLDS